MNFLIFLLQCTSYGLVVGFPFEGRDYYETSTTKDPLPEDPTKAGHENNNTYHIVVPNKNSSSNTTSNSNKEKDSTNEIGDRFLPERRQFEIFSNMKSGVKMQRNIASEPEIPPMDVPANPLISSRMNNLGNNISHQPTTDVMNAGNNNESEEYTDDELKEQLILIFGAYNNSSNELSVPNAADKDLNAGDIGPYSGEYKNALSTPSADAYFPIKRIIFKHAVLSNTKRNKVLINHLQGLETNHESMASSASENSSASVNPAEIPQMLRESTTMRNKPLLNNTRTNNTSKTFKPDIILISLICFVFYYNHY